MIRKERLRQVEHILEKYDKRKKEKKSKRCPVCGIKLSVKLGFCPNCNHVMPFNKQ